MTKRSSACSSREAAICNQGHFLIQSLTSKSSSYSKHFTHTRTTLWTFIADNNNIPTLNFAVLNSFHSFTFIVENPRRTCVLHKFFSTGRTFYNSSIWSKISKQNCKSAVVAERVFNRAQNFRFTVTNSGNIFCHSFTGYSHKTCINQIFLSKLCKNSLYSTRIIKLTHKGVACRSKVTQVRSSVGNLIYHVKIN